MPSRTKLSTKQRARQVSILAICLTISSFVLGIGVRQASAQYIKLDTPFQANSESYYERLGINFGFSLPGSQNTSGSRIVGLNPDGSFTQNGSLRFSQNGAGSAVPPFGGYDPNNDATFGWGVINPNGGGYNLGFNFGQGNTRTSTSTTPTIVVPNGIPGSISDQQFRPFVTGITPVVGGIPGGNAYNMIYSPGPPVSPLQLKLQMLRQDIDSGRAHFEDGRLVMHGDPAPSPSGGGQAYVEPEESTANRSDLSVAEIRRQRRLESANESAANQAEIDKWVADAESLIEKGKLGAARICLRSAIRLSTGQQQLELQERFNEISQD